MSGTTTVYVVRHAVAEDRNSWTRPDAKRPLTPTGMEQAVRLAERFGGDAIRVVLSSPSVRCLQTVQPLAQQLGLDVKVAEQLQEGAPADGALRFLVKQGEPKVLGCTHGDVIDGLLGVLVRSGVLADGRVSAKKASTWILTLDAGAVRNARYVAPP